VRVKEENGGVIKVECALFSRREDASWEIEVKDGKENRK
jgi:hypothetical protein